MVVLADCSAADAGRRGGIGPARRAVLPGSGACVVVPSRRRAPDHRRPGAQLLDPPVGVAGDTRPRGPDAIRCPGPSAGTTAIDGWPAWPRDAGRLLRGWLPRQGSAVRAVVGNTRNQDHHRHLHAIGRTPRTAQRRTVRSSPARRRTAGMIRTSAGGRRGAYEASSCPRFSISASTTAQTDRHRSPRSCGNSRPRQAGAPAAEAPAMHLSAAPTGPAPASVVDGRHRDSTLQLHSHWPVDPSAYGPGRERCRPTEPSRRRWLLATRVNPRTRQSRSVRAPRPQKRSSCRAPGGACATSWRAPGLAVYAP